jgi:hypothetical protein
MIRIRSSCFAVRVSRGVGIRERTRVTRVCSELTNALGKVQLAQQANMLFFLSIS